VKMRWGMPPPPRAGGYPVTNIRNTSSPHWRAWLSRENRCLVPANSFAEYAPEQNPETKRRFQMVFPYKIRLRADWIAVILALSARLPAMDDRHHRSSPEIGR
jgi:putative SOS response-associated peptidase YedK